MSALPCIAHMVTEALIADCIRQKTKAQYALYKALYPMMRSICARYERDTQEAAALMNQRFLKILQNLDSRREQVPFEPWARRIIINTVIDRFRRESVRPDSETLTDAMDDTQAGEVNAYLHVMEAEAAAALLDRLPPMSRQVFNLFAIDGLSHAEVAELFSISEGTSKWHVSHARTVLKKAIAEMAEQRLNTPQLR